MIPEDAVRPFGEYRDFIIRNYNVPEEDVDGIIEQYGLLCSPSEQRLLFPFRYEVRGLPGEQTYAEEGWPKRVVAVWGRALRNFTRWEGPNFRYWIRPEDARPLYIPKLVPFSVVLVTEGAMDAIKLQHYLPDVQACGSYKAELSNECFSVMQQTFGRHARCRVVYDAGNYAQASKNARLLRERGFRDSEPVLFPHKDPGACTVEQLKEWQSTSF